MSKGDQMWTAPGRERRWWLLDNVRDTAKNVSEMLGDQ